MQDRTDANSSLRVFLDLFAAGGRARSAFVQERLRLLFDSAGAFIAGNLVSALVLAAGLWLLTDNRAGYAWLIAMVLAAVAQLLVVLAASQRRNWTPVRRYRLGLLYSLGCGVSGLVWASAVLLVAPAPSASVEIFVAAVLLAVTLTGLATLFAWLPAWAALTWPVLGALSISLLRAGDPGHTAFAMLALLLLGVLSFTAVRLSAGLGEQLLAGQRNRGLLRQLRDIEEEAEHTLQRLEGEMRARVGARQALQVEKERLQVALESVGDGVMTTDMQGRVEYISPVAERLTGWLREEVVEQPASRVIRLREQGGQDWLPDAVAACLQERRRVRLTGEHLWLQTRNGSEVPVELTASPLRRGDQSMVGAVVVLHDMRLVRGLTEHAAYQARHDGLTGLHNRREFESGLQQMLVSASAPGALVYLDVDQFKLINEVSGHVAGDRLLVRLGALLKHWAGEDDLPGRLGDDEFAVLIQPDEEDAMLARVEDLLTRIRALDFRWRDHAWQISASVGVVLTDQADGDINSLLVAADSACCVAKQLGGNRLHVYHERDEHIAQQHGEMRWAQQLPQALAEQRMRLFAQPIVALREDAPGRQVELLLRIEDEHGEVIEANRFISAAERYHLITGLDRWVLEEGLKALESGHGALADVTLCFINLSGRTLGDAAFLEYARERILDSDIDPRRLCFEITETAAISSLNEARHFLGSLREIGCRFALDDFGSGLSSYAYLKNLPVDFLKIDGAFVRSMVSDERDHAMVSSINQLGHVLGMQTVAEFVENDVTLEALRGLGVDHVQGHRTGRPERVA